MRPAEISLIISTYERPDALEKVLWGVLRQQELPGEILIADDGSGVATRELIAQWQKKFPVPLRHLWQEHDGFRKAIVLNKALAAATGAYVVLLDGDCVPHRQFISDHASLAENGAWVQGRRCFVREEFVGRFKAGFTPVLPWWLAGRIGGLAKGIRLPVPIVRRDTDLHGILGCNMGIWRNDLIAINGFDESYTGWGGEDSDLGARLYNLGRIRKFVHGHAVVFHLDHPALDRSGFDDAMRRVADVLKSKTVRCGCGLDQYITGAKSA